jgi:hypothetical protein
VSGAVLSVSGPARFATLVLTGGGADLSGPLSADTVSLAAATLSGGDMTIGRLLWTDGTLSTSPSVTGSGTTTVGAGGLLLSGTAPKTLLNRTLVLTGNSVVDSTGGALALDGAAIRNAALLEFRSDANVTVTGTGIGTLTNTATGTLRKSAGTGSTAIALPVTNLGTIDVERGTLQLASLNSGSLGGGTYDLAGTLLVRGLDVTANAGTIRLTGSGGLNDGVGDALAGLTTNTGTLELDGRDLALTGGLANSGTVRLGGATLTTAGPYVQSAGLTSLAGATLHAGAPVRLDGGRLEGTGTVAPGLRNAGTVAPGAPLAVTGDYTQTGAGTLAAPPGRLAVSGAATLAGAVSVDPGSVTLSDGATFPLLTAAAVTGQWAAPTPPAGSTDYTFDVTYAATGATLTAHAPPPHPLPCCVPPTPPPPVPGKSATTDAVSGTVLVKVPGTDGFTALVPGKSVPVGTLIDATKGRVSLTAASTFDKTSKAPPTQLSVAAAIFRLEQKQASKGLTAVTDLVIQTPAGAQYACAPHKGVRRPSPHATIRRIRATVAKGVVRTLGKAAMLRTRNASFSLRDRCDGTSARLVRGKGTLLDQATGRRVHLSARAHRAYLARALLFRIRSARLRVPKVPHP